MRQTSIKAKESSKQMAFTHRKRIFLMLLKKSKGTTSQIAQWLVMDYHAVARRMSELVSLNKIKGETTTICPIKNRSVILWEIKEDAI
jgi:predicted ArsR family transcriptional regulator